MKRLLNSSCKVRATVNCSSDLIHSSVSKRARSSSDAAAQVPGNSPSGAPDGTSTATAGRTMSASAVSRNGWTQLGEGSLIGYWPRMLSGMSQKAMHALLEDVQWQQRDLIIFGRAVAQPRLVAYMADADTPPYTYSGLTLQPLPWSEIVSEVKAAVEQLYPGTVFNSCLLNLYRDGHQHVSWHSDNEKLYGNQPTIASVSFGAARDFTLRHNLDRNRKLSITLAAGDVLLMAGTTQEHWQHCLPKRRGVTQPRINLTFRTIVSGSAA